MNWLHISTALIAKQVFFSSITLIVNISLMLFNESMKTIDEIRKENLAILVKDYGGVGKLADVLERSSSQVSQWLNSSKASASGKPRRFNSDSARYIEKMCGKPEGWLDTANANGTTIACASKENWRINQTATNKTRRSGFFYALTFHQ